MTTASAILHPELLDPDMPGITRDGHRLDHAEAASKPLRSRPEPQPRGAKVHGNRPIDQAEAAARFIAAPEHEKMHDERQPRTRTLASPLRHSVRGNRAEARAAREIGKSVLSVAC
jgi:hypothetical protein